MGLSCFVRSWVPVLSGSMRQPAPQCPQNPAFLQNDYFVISFKCCQKSECNTNQLRYIPTYSPILKITPLNQPNRYIPQALTAFTNNQQNFNSYFYACIYFPITFIWFLKPNSEIIMVLLWLCLICPIGSDLVHSITFQYVLIMVEKVLFP